MSELCQCISLHKSNNINSKLRGLIDQNFHRIAMSKGDMPEILDATRVLKELRLPLKLIEANQEPLVKLAWYLARSHGLWQCFQWRDKDSFSLHVVFGTSRTREHDTNQYHRYNLIAIVAFTSPPSGAGSLEHNLKISYKKMRFQQSRFEKACGINLIICYSGCVYAINKVKLNTVS